MSSFPGFVRIGLSQGIDDAPGTEYADSNSIRSKPPPMKIAAGLLGDSSRVGKPLVKDSTVEKT